MSRGHGTLLWIADGAPRTRAEMSGVVDGRMDVNEVKLEAIETAIAAARTHGPVVAVGPRDALAKLLQLGADEALAWGSPSNEISDAIERARSRAQWRASQDAAQSNELAGLAFMSAAIGHEIRNPLTAAMINCHTIEALVQPETTSDVHGALSDLGEALRSIAQVVSQMVSLADSGDVGVCDLARTLVELTTYVHKEVELAADFEVEIPETACPVALSRTRAVEVVAAVLNNAVHAVERLTARRGRISLRLTLEDEMVVVEVTDNGVGMSSEVRKQAFTPFFTTRRPGALGMGLTFAAMHVRRANGEILLDSEVDEGTSVRMFLPRIEALPPVSPRFRN